MTESHTVTTPDGWSLQLQRGAGGGGPPVLFVPGYGMNGWIFHNHPSGRSFMKVLSEAGLDPWSVDLRGTSTSHRGPGAPAARMSDQAGIDLVAALDHIRDVTGAERVHGIGCSLGGALLYAHAASPEHRLDRLVGIASPLVWGADRRTRALGRLLGVSWVPVRGARRAAGWALPVVGRLAPRLLSIYLNPSITTPSGSLAQTVEDPIPAIDRAIGAWMRGRDLRMGGQSVREALLGFDRPLLVLHGSGDGIVPRDAALSVVGATGGSVEVQEVQHPSGEGVGHADLFVSDIAPEQVFARTARFLLSS